MPVELITFENQNNNASQIDIWIGDCLEYLATHPENAFDAIITDPPYEVALHNQHWDQTGISFSADLWTTLFRVLKPGGFVAAFAMPRLYHRLATAAEDAGFSLYPFLTWQFDGGLPKPINLSELFDRDNVAEREVIGYRNGSGFTTANVTHGAQGRTHTKFPIYARHVSSEAKEWKGFYYGVNALKPCQEPILLAQKPIESDRAIDNIRMWRTGALNLGALADRYGTWPATIFRHKKARKKDHQSNHVSVKPTSLMQELCLLLCPPGGQILDPFAGTGTTGVAARNCGFSCVLLESNPEMQAVIRRRLTPPPSAPTGTSECDFSYEDDPEHP